MMKDEARRIAVNIACRTGQGDAKAQNVDWRSPFDQCANVSAISIATIARMPNVQSSHGPNSSYILTPTAS
jgi:hypothetical protein